MKIEKITYEDFNETERTEEFHFHLSDIDLAKLEAGTPGGYQAYIQKIADAKDNAKMIEAVENLIKLAYCEVKEDGRSIRRSPELSEDFVNCPAYIVLLEKLFKDPKNATEFFIDILPKDKAKLARQELAKNPELLKSVQ